MVQGRPSNGLPPPQLQLRSALTVEHNPIVAKILHAARHERVGHGADLSMAAGTDSCVRWQSVGARTGPHLPIKAVVLSALPHRAPRLPTHGWLPAHTIVVRRDGCEQRDHHQVPKSNQSSSSPIPLLYLYSTLLYLVCRIVPTLSQ